MKMNKVFALFTLERDGAKKLNSIILLNDILSQYGSEYAEEADTIEIGQELSLYPLREDLHLKRINDLPNDLRDLQIN